MAYISASAPSKAVEDNYSFKNVARIIGLVCIFGFFFDILVLAMPPQGSVEWRIGLVQELANRSIILLFGLGLFIFGNAGRKRSSLRLASKLSMGIGVIFFLLCLLSIIDSVRLNNQSATAISAQETQLQTQIEEAKANPEGLPENIDLTQLDQVSRQLTQQANTLRSSTRRTVFKTGISNIGNLLIVGIGLLGLGRSGMKLSRSRG